MHSAALRFSFSSISTFFGKNNIIKPLVNPYPLLIALGIITVLGSIALLLTSAQVLPIGLNALTQLGTLGYFVGSSVFMSGCIFSAIGIIRDPKRWNFFQLTQKDFKIKDRFSICSHSLGNGIYKIGVFLTRPFLYQANIATKLICKNPYPGKSLEGIKTSKRVLRFVNASILFTIVIPLITGLIALLGFCFRAVGTLFRPPASLIVNPAIAFQSYEEGQTIKFLTYNVALMPNFIRNLNNMRSSNKRAEEIGRILSTDLINSDTICFQECFDLKATEKLCEFLKLNYPNIVHNIAPRETGLGSGLVIASKFKITDLSFTRFQDTGGEDTLANKGVVKVSLDAGEKKIHMFNTHLQAKEGETYIEIRKKQVQTIKNFVKTCNAQESPHLAVVSGDFNASYFDSKGGKSLEYGQVCDQLSNFTNLYYTDHNHDGTAKNTAEQNHVTGTWFNKASANWGTAAWGRETISGCVLDHIFSYSQIPRNIKTEIKPVEAPWQCYSGYSDHLPLEAHVTL